MATHYTCDICGTDLTYDEQGSEVTERYHINKENGVTLKVNVEIVTSNGYEGDLCADCTDNLLKHFDENYENVKERATV